MNYARMTGCDLCDDQNVRLPSFFPFEELAELHMALHDLGRELARPFEPVERFMLDRIAIPLARALDGDA